MVSLSDSVLHAGALCFAAPQGGTTSRQMLAVFTNQSASMVCRRFSVFLNSTETAVLQEVLKEQHLVETERMQRPASVCFVLK